MIQSSVVTPLLSQILTLENRTNNSGLFFVSLISRDYSTPLINYLSKSINKIPVNSNQQKVYNEGTKIEQLEHEIDDLTHMNDEDYINAGQSSEFLNVLGLKVISDWKNQEKEPWHVYQHQNLRFYVYDVDQKYAVMVCSEKNFPAAIIIGKLEKICKELKDKL